MLLHHNSMLQINKDDKIFINLSTVELEGCRKEPGYYGFYADHDPSNSISLSDSQNKFSEDKCMQSENLCSVDNGQVKSAESHYSKLAVYEKGKLV